MFFFFSSRRRHTRYIDDWSSDVCSSDLQQAECGGAETAAEAEGDPGDDGGGRARVDADHVRAGQRVARDGLEHRSEERRVGKECRSQWVRGLYEKRSGEESNGEQITHTT